MTTTITIGYLPMPEVTAHQLKLDWDALQSQIIMLVNTHAREHMPQWVIDDYKDLRRQQLAIEAQRDSLFNNN